MSITITNPEQCFTANNTAIWNSQTAASLSFWLRPEVAGLVVGQAMTGVQRQANYSVTSTMTVLTLPVGATPGTVSFAISVYLTTGYSRGTVTLNAGQIYHLAVTHAPGAQWLYLNGQQIAMGTSSLATQTANVGFGFGWSGASNSLQYTIHDIASWNGYTLTQGEVLSILFGMLPSALGTPPTSEWTLAGTAGNTPHSGDAGLLCSDGVNNLLSPTGTGSAVYSANLGFTPTVLVNDAYIATSNKIVGVTFQSGGSLTPVTSTTALPTLLKNGAGVGYLALPWITGVENCILYHLPAGVMITSTDSWSVSAPDGFVITAAGPALGLTNQPLNNYAGKSAVGTDSLVKTFKPGMIFGIEGPIDYDPYWLAANMRYRLGGFQGSTNSLDGAPVTITGTSATAPLMSCPATNTNAVDNTLYPTPVGVFAIGWDATGDDSWSIVAHDGFTTVTEDTLAANPGTGGVGKVRVFNCQRATGSPSSAINLSVTITKGTAGQASTTTNLWIAGPGDFTYVPATPTVLEKSNPYKLSNTVLSRFANGIGSMRFTDQFASDWVSDPEQLRSISNFSWGAATYFTKTTLSLNQAQPWVPANSPYWYTDQFGTPYTGTLGLNITTTPAAGQQETYTFTDALASPTAATGPIMIGQRIQIDSEVCRIMGVTQSAIAGLPAQTGTAANVTIERGSAGTTPATHSSGSVSVMNRVSINPNPWGKQRIVEIQTSTLHGMRSGPAIKVGGWPSITYADGYPMTWNGTFAFLVTGPYTLLLVWDAFIATWSGTVNTIASPVSLSGGTAVLTTPGYTGVSYDFAASMVNQFTGCVYHCNTDYAMNDDCLRKAAAQIFSNMDSTHDLWIEVSDEPWNYAQGPDNGFYLAASYSLYPSGFGLEAYCLQALHHKSVFQSVATSLGWAGNIYVMLNTHTAVASQTSSYLTFCQANSLLPDAIATTAYINPDTTNASYQWTWQSDDDQVVDWWIHHMMYCAGSSGIRTALNANQAYITSYNLATGRNVGMYSYESGCVYALPAFPSAVTLSSSCLSTDTSVVLSNVSWVVPLMYLVVDGTTAGTGNITMTNGSTSVTFSTSQSSGLAGSFIIAVNDFTGPYQLTSVSGTSGTISPAFAGGNLTQAFKISNQELMQVGSSWDGVSTTVPVTRGLGYLPQIPAQSIAHSSGANVRNIAQERSEDIVMNPNFRQAELDFRHLEQMYYLHGNDYAYSFYSVENQWALYKSNAQLPGKGDGTDGRANNRLTYAAPGPGKTVKPAMTNIYNTNVSPRGQAFLDWMGQLSPTLPIYRGYLRRRGAVWTVPGAGL
jgi:hypothetical protein